MTDNEQITGKFTSKVAKSDWAVAPSVTSDEEEKPKTFLERIAPKSKKGRVVFAASTAQVVSICLVACAGYIFKNHKPKVVKNFERSLLKRFNSMATNYTGNEMEKGPGLLRPSKWKAFMDFDDYQAVKRYSGDRYTTRGGDKADGAKDDIRKHVLQARTLAEFIIMGVTNIVSTVAIRNVLDKRLDINLGGQKVFKTQMIDTAVGIGAMLMIPNLAPKNARDARLGIRNLVNKWPVKGGAEQEKKRDLFGQSLGFSAVNIALPDFIGFAAGVNDTFRELDALEKQKEAEQKIEEAEAKNSGPSRA